MLVSEIIGETRLVSEAVAVAVHPTASVTVSVFEHEARPLALAFVVELFQLNVYGVVPEVNADAMLPLLIPHVASVGVSVTITGGVVAIVVDAVAMHPLASVTVRP